MVGNRRDYLDMLAEENRDRTNRRKKIGDFVNSNPREARKIFRDIFK